MSTRFRLTIGVLLWLLAVTALHLWLNTDFFARRAGAPADSGPVFRVGFLPVT